MTRRLRRSYGSGYLHFITSSCYRRSPLLGTSRRRNLFLKILEQTRVRYGFAVIGYVVMPEHTHLLIGECDHATPATIMQVLKQRFARRVLGDQRRCKNSLQGSLWQEAQDSRHVWQRRYYDFVVRTEDKGGEAQIHSSQSSEARVVLEPDQWAWSSFRWYARGERGLVLVNEQRRAELKVRFRQSFRTDG